MTDRPNIVVILADQLRTDVLGAYGGRRDVSPRIDRLAEESVLFDRHLTNCPLCVPARISMATGLMPHRHGAIVNAWDPEEQPWGTCRGKPTFYESLARAGYQVEHIGVDHLRCDPPISQRDVGISFHATVTEHRQMLGERGRVIDLSACKSPCVDFCCGRPVVRDYTNANAVPWPGPAEEFYDSFIADHAVRRIARADDLRPLALLVNFWSPHCPLTAPAPYYSMFDPDGLTLPANVGQWYDGQSPMQLINLPGHVAASMTEAGWRQAWAVYLGMVRMLDDCVGRVLDALQLAGRLDDSVLLFSADHGEMLGSHRMFQKMCMYEEAIRVPLLVRARGATAGRRKQLTQHLGLAATICDYAGAEPPADSEGASFRSVVEDPAGAGLEHVFIEFNGNSGRGFQQRAIVADDAKFIYNHGYDSEFYDTTNDPLETRNLCGDGRPTGRAAELAARLRDWMRSTSDYLAMPQLTEASGPA